MSINNRLRRLERQDAARVKALDAEIVAEARRLGLSDAELIALAAELDAMSDEELLRLAQAPELPDDPSPEGS